MNVTDHGLVHALLAPAVERFAVKKLDEQDEVRDALDGYVRAYSFLSQVVDFGDVALEAADQRFFDQMEATWLGDPYLVAQARANPLENFRLVFADRFIKSIVERMDDNADIFGKILDEPAFQAVVMEHYLQRVFEGARREAR